MPYIGNTLADLNITEPNGATEPVAVHDDAIRQIKRYLTLVQPGEISGELTTLEAYAKLPVGTVVDYADAASIWSAPTNFLKCDGKTIGKASSAADYKSDDYEALFNLLKSGFGNTGAENWASGHTVKLPLLSDSSSFDLSELVITAISATTGNGGSLGEWVESTSGGMSVISDISLSNITTGAPLGSLVGIEFELRHGVKIPNITRSATTHSVDIEVSFDAGISYLYLTSLSLGNVTASTSSFLANCYIQINNFAGSIYFKFKADQDRTSDATVLFRAAMTKAYGYALRPSLRKIIRAK
ncbi:MAG: hypothetical protein HC840_01205 [Leptolyngbyaceae cyanobacterium RM2_2_4]|nr:hypothetical protein [Leptolyngbyaceae cyanobacterium RM2_2_4]